MRSAENLPELSVIIPTLNEAEALPRLLADLAAQRGLDFEVIVSDGGSNDATCAMATATFVRGELSGEVLTGPVGRGRQLNRGTRAARGTWLLFLHADSRLPDPAALADGLACLRRERNPRLAGRFSLKFDRANGERDVNYDLCELKARLDLPGTIHGDQGFLLNRVFWDELGGFREDLPVLEDTLLAETVRSRGRWRRLPATIVTSPRRFQAEGFARRQTLNAMLMNCVMIGWDEPLRRAPGIYRPQGETRPLQPAFFVRVIDACLKELPVRERAGIWYRTGAYVRGNAWQLILRRLARQAFAAGQAPDGVSLEKVERFRHRFDALTAHPAGHLAAALLTWLWFRSRRRRPVQGE